MVSAGYYAIDLHDYGVSSYTTNINVISGYPNIKTYSFTYNIKTLCRNYGIDYTALTEDDFVCGYANATAPSYTNVSGSYVSGYLYPITKSYDATNGKLTLGSICMTATVTNGTQSRTSAEFTSDQIVCMLVPQSVVVD